jgi:L-seryl-tRNA(Ser) seleniumtransferase
MKVDEELRALPSVEEVAAALGGVSRRLAVAAARDEIAHAREEILAGRAEAPAVEVVRQGAAERAARDARGSLTRVINATGVVLHTNLGRAPLARQAAEAAAEVAAGYSNLEYDVESGGRSNRNVHVERLLRDLTGAEAALVVNNNAAAVLLALAATASGREVIVSRGQLIEIGGEFRIPDILALSGARMVEVGTTNRTRLSDYESAITERTAALLRVHQSNFSTIGFVESVALSELCALARERGLATIDDPGSGAVTVIEDEPTLAASVAAGADLVCSSADKLLGGPQAGIICGRAEAIDRARRHPLARALRLDKLQLAALEATLRLYRDLGADAIPVPAMLSAPQEDLSARAELIAETVGEPARITQSTSRPGGGSLPLVELPGPVCEVDPGDLGADRLAAELRSNEPPVVARIARDRVILDPRTMTDAEAAQASEAVRRALG